MFSKIERINEDRIYKERGIAVETPHRFGKISSKTVLVAADSDFYGWRTSNIIRNPVTVPATYNGSIYVLFVCKNTKDVNIENVQEEPQLQDIAYQKMPRGRGHKPWETVPHT